MSVAVIPMAAELGWSASDRGLVSSAFFWGYSATQIPAGWVSTRCCPFLHSWTHATLHAALECKAVLDSLVHLQPKSPPLRLSVCLMMSWGCLQDRGRKGAAGGCGLMVFGHSTGTSGRQDQPPCALRLPRFCAHPCPIEPLDTAALFVFIINKGSTLDIGSNQIRPSYVLCSLLLQVGLGEGLAPSSATNVMAKLVPE